MTDAPFNQYVSVKKRDQGYQTIKKGSNKLRFDDLRQIFHQEKAIEVVPIVESQNDTLILKCAFNIAKCVPHQTNQCKWREKSGFAPNMLHSSSNSGKLFSGDLVFIRYLNNKLINLIVTEDVFLDDLEMSLKVRIPQENTSTEVKLEQLVKDGNSIVALPSNKYHIDCNGKIEIDDGISYMFDALMNKEIVSRTDIEWNEFLRIQTSDNCSDLLASVEPDSSDKEFSEISRKIKRRKMQPF